MTFAIRSAHRRAWLLAAVTGLLSVAAGAQTITRGPYIQNLRPDAVTLLWRTDQPTVTTVRVRPQGLGDWTKYQTTVPSTAHELAIPGLRPDTLYDYCVGDGDPADPVCVVSSFRTFASEEATTTSFVVYGDHRNNPEAHRSVIEAVLARASQDLPRFILDTGDYTGDGQNKTDFWDEQFFGPERDLMRRVCLFPVIGNHESPGRWPRIPFRYFQNFAVPTGNSGSEYYYSFEYGNAHFCMIDVWASEFTKGSKQYAWIEQDLKKSPKPWKFAAFHIPPFVCQTAPSVLSGNEDVRTTLVPLFQKYGVSVVFNGDCHFYQRSEVEGIQYVCTGGGGAPLYTPGNTEPYVKASKKVYHYCWATLQGSELLLRAYDTNNEQIDEFVAHPRIPEKPPRPALNFVRKLPDEHLEQAEATIVESRTAEGRLTPAPAYAETGAWYASTVKSTAPGVQGHGTRFSDNRDADAMVRFTPSLNEAGPYLISITTPSASTVDAPNTLFLVSPGASTSLGGVPPAGNASPPTDTDASESTGEFSVADYLATGSFSPSSIWGTVPLTAGECGNQWYDLGVFDLSPGASITFVEPEDAPGRFYADAVKFTRYVRK